MNTSNGCPKCGRKDLRTLTWRELGIDDTSLGCWDCDWVTYPPGINADNWQQKMLDHKRATEKYTMDDAEMWGIIMRKR